MHLVFSLESPGFILIFVLSPHFQNVNSSLCLLKLMLHLVVNLFLFATTKPPSQRKAQFSCQIKTRKGFITKFFKS